MASLLAVVAVVLTSETCWDHYKGRSDAYEYQSHHILYHDVVWIPPMLSRRVSSALTLAPVGDAAKVIILTSVGERQLSRLRLASSVELK